MNLCKFGQVITSIPQFLIIVGDGVHWLMMLSSSRSQRIGARFQPVRAEAAMAERTGIEWCDATWNPTRGCSVASPSCAHCYAAPATLRMERMGVLGYEGLAKHVHGNVVFTGEVRDAPEHVLRWGRAAVFGGRAV